MVLFGYSWARAGAPRMDVMTTRLDARVAAVARNEFFRFSIMELPSRCWLGIGCGELIRRTIHPAATFLMSVRDVASHRVPWLVSQWRLPDHQEGRSPPH